jgi:rhamnosyltransferase
VAAAASVIVRTRDKERTIGATLASLRAQTVAAEIILVDSGSTDRTLEIARESCDRVIEIPPEEFTYGRALNIGAEAASAPIHFALSAHCVADRTDWIERSLAHYQRADVAATNGLREFSERERPDERHDPFEGRRERGTTFFQDIEHARRHPFWGFSNHASSWRAGVWASFPFDESLDYAEDKEWARRVLGAGWLIAFDPALHVDMSHVWRTGLVEFYTRQKRAARAITTFATVQPYTARDLAADWWARGPGDHPLRVRRLANPLRTAGLIGRYRGFRQARAGR